MNLGKIMALLINTGNRKVICNGLEERHATLLIAS